ncbi:MAG TPA: glycosyltransferase [Candidatus Limnocylindrales bacterium]|nr:glycosyltransferase [Candidatus Limnocylindrales bacterium]
MTSSTARRRAVVLVGGPAAPYSRAVRIARALAAEGFDVEIAAIAAPGLPEREPVAEARPGTVGEPAADPAAVGRIEIHRYRPRGIWAVLGASEAASGATAAGAAAAAAGATPHGGGGLRRTLRRVARTVGVPVLVARRWLFWPHAVRGWWAALARDLAPADLYHACGSLTIAAALEARRRDRIGPSGGPARVIYDAIDDVAESNEAVALPALVRGRHARTEAAWAHSADAVLAVNDALAARLAARWDLAHPPLVVANLPEPRPSAPGRPDLLRGATGLPAATRVVLFHGRLGPGLGLEEAAEAVVRVPDAALVLLGFGRGMPASHARDRDPRYAGRHHTLAARDPDELLDWVASADVALIPLPPVSINQRLSTPNKLWEALAAGTPVVVVRGLEVMERLVEEHDLGAVAASTDAADLAAAIEAVLDRLVAEGDGWRERIAAVGRERFSWPPAATAYRSLVRSFDSAAAHGRTSGRLG